MADVTIEWANEKIEEIRDRADAHQWQAAHSLEDEFYFTVLDAIASGTCNNPKALAALAITTNKINISRRCA